MKPKVPQNRRKIDSKWSQNEDKSEKKTRSAEGRILEVKKWLRNNFGYNFGSQNGLQNREKCRQNSASFLRSVPEGVFSRSARFWSGLGRFLEAKTGPGRDSRARGRIWKNSGFTMQKYDFPRFGPSQIDWKSTKKREQIKVGFESRFLPTFAFLGRFWAPKSRPKLRQNLEKNEVKKKMPKLCNDWY
jgi:hypothetical protein